MQYRTCTVIDYLDIQFREHIIEGRNRIKYARRGTKAIEYITARKGELTEKLYALAKEILVTNDDGEHFAYVMNNYNLPTIQEKITEINRKKILLTINQVVNELLAIDVIYWDIHCCNFLVNKDKVIAIDLDEAQIGKESIGLNKCRNHYIDLLLHIYIGYLFSQDANYFNVFMSNFKIESYFSKDTCDYLKDIYNSYDEQLDRDPSFLIEEFEDTERLACLEQRVRTLKI